MSFGKKKQPVVEAAPAVAPAPAAPGAISAVRDETIRAVNLRRKQATLLTGVKAAGVLGRKTILGTPIK